MRITGLGFLVENHAGLDAMTFIADPIFYLAAIPAVMFLGVSKGGCVRRAGGEDDRQHELKPVKTSQSAGSKPCMCAATFA